MADVLSVNFPMAALARRPPNRQSGLMSANRSNERPYMIKRIALLKLRMARFYSTAEVTLVRRGYTQGHGVRSAKWLLESKSVLPNTRNSLYILDIQVSILKNNRVPWILDAVLVSAC
jgi:hypothetical protein